MVHITGLMVKLMKASGSMESNMERPGLQIQRDAANWDFGKMVNELNGLKQARVQSDQGVRNPLMPLKAV